MIESFYYTNFLFKITFLAYIITLLGYTIGLFNDRKLTGKIGLWLFTISFLISTTLIAMRWIEAGRPPFKSIYESLIFATWTISLVSIISELKFKIRLIGLLSTLSIIGILLYSLTKRDVEIIALPPALQTWMFIPHVISYFLAYGALFVAGIGASLQLVYPVGIVSHHSLGENSRLDFSAITYQISKFGFFFLTVGLLLGAWWGQNAWSNYWGWDPKENWAFITWLIFAAYLHFRNISSIDKQRLSWIVIIGVLVIIFTYLGMDYLPTANDSLHTYSSD